MSNAQPSRTTKRALAAAAVLGTCLLAATTMPRFDVNAERKIVAHYPNGDTLFEVTAKDNKWDGDFVYYHRIGLVSQAGSYKNGKKHGNWKTWDILDGDSHTESEGAFVSGNEEGQWTFYSSATEKSEQGMMRKGKRTGIWKEWWPNGKQKSEGAYDEDEERTGDWKVWTEDGEIDLEESGKYQNGTRIN